MPGLPAAPPNRTSDRVWAPVVVVAGLLSVVLTVLLIRLDGDVSRLVRAAPPWTDPALTDPSLTVLPHEYEFDGQFFYRLALAPFSSATTVDGVTFDIPAMRGQRWGLGVAGWAASLGQPSLAPWALVLINAGSLVTLAYLGARFAQTSGLSSWWGILLPLWPGFAYTLTLDTSELLASTLMCAGLLAARGRMWLWAALWISLAIVTRETTLVAAVGLLIAGLWAKASGWWPGRRTNHEGDGTNNPTNRAPNDAAGRAPVGNGEWIAGLFGVAVFVASQLFARNLYGKLPITAAAGNNAGLPLHGFAVAIGESFPPATAGSALRLASLIFVLWMTVVGACTLRSSTARLAEKVAWLGSATFVVVLNENPLANAPSIVRTATEMGLLTVVILFGARSRLLVPTAVSIVVVSAASIGTMVITVPQL